MTARLAPHASRVGRAPVVQHAALVGQAPVVEHEALVWRLEVGLINLDGLAHMLRGNRKPWDGAVISGRRFWQVVVGAPVLQHVRVNFDFLVDPILEPAEVGGFQECCRRWRRGHRTGAGPALPQALPAQFAHQSVHGPTGSQGVGRLGLEYSLCIPLVLLLLEMTLEWMLELALLLL